MENTDTFQIRRYGWQELALCYSPDVSADAATKQLRRWVDYNPELTQALINAGWKKGNRVLSPLQVGILVHYLGEP